MLAFDRIDTSISQKETTLYHRRLSRALVAAPAFACAALLAACNGGSATAVPAPVTPVPTATPAPLVHVADACANAIFTFASTASGNVAPASTIAGSATTLQNPFLERIDPATGQLAVTNPFGFNVLTFAKGASGNATPARNVSASNSSFAGVAFDASGAMYVSNQQPASIDVYAPGSTGAVAPVRTIAGTATGIGTLNDIAVDAAGNIYVVNNNFGAAPEIDVFAAGANGNVAPVAVITNAAGSFITPSGIAFDGAGNLWVADYRANALFEFPAGKTGNLTPSTTIAGANTGLNEPSQLAFDASGRIYAANGRNAPSVTVYAAGASGNAAPVATIAGSATGFVCPTGIAVQ